MDNKRTTGLRIEGTTELINGRWLCFRRKHFIDREGQAGQWDYVERTAAQQAAVVVARTRSTGKLILVRQFRIPMEAWIYEFPAGLVDPGESIASTAHRELAEETGYAGRIISISEPVPTGPGLTTETVHIVRMEADDIPAPHEHEASEAIEVLTLELSTGPVQALVDKAKAEGDLIDSKLLTYLLHWL